MRTQEEIIKRVGVLTATIGRLNDERYNIVLQDKDRKCIWELHNIDKHIMRAFAELQILEWVLNDRRGYDGER